MLLKIMIILTGLMLVATNLPLTSAVLVGIGAILAHAGFERQQPVAIQIERG